MDRRSSKTEVLMELRERAVALKKQGMTHQAIAQALAIGESTSRLYWRLHQKAGQQGLVLKKRGRRPGTQRRLTARQEKSIQRAITDKTPDQLKMPFALWTREAVGELIFQRYGLGLPVRTLGEYLKRWGFTPQKPKKRDYARQPQKVRRWLDQEYPALKARAKAEKADIYWGDETGVNNQDQIGRSYAPRGQTPIRRARTQKVSSSMISALNNKGQLRFMLYPKALTAQRFIEFLKRLVRSTPRKVILIVDNLRAHRAAAVEHWLTGREQEIEVHYLPAYSPDLNPDEYLNNALKKQLDNQIPAGSLKEQQQRIRNQMHSNQKRPRFLTSLFQAPAIAYAA